MEVLHDDDFVFLTAAAIAVAVVFEWTEAAVTASMALVIWVKFLKPPFDTRQYQLPPKAPFGFFETVRSITTKEIVDFFPKVHRSIKGNVARLNFLVPQCNYCCLIVDTELSRDILNDKTTIKAEGISKTFDRVTDGVSLFFTSNDDRYFHARKAMAPAFANNQIQRMNRIVAKKTDEWIENYLEPRVTKGQPIELPQAMIDITFNIIMEAAFDYEMAPSEREALLEALDITLREFIFSNPLKNAFGSLFPSVRRARRKAKELMAIVDNIIHAYKKNPNSTPGTAIDLIMKNPKYNNDRERAADMTSLIVAGHDTSATSLSFLLLELAKNPIEQFKLQKELRELSEEDQVNSEQLKRCIRESLRLYPVSAPGPFRQLGRDFVVRSIDEKEKDTMIPKGSAVFMPIICLLRHPEIFEDCDNFVPSRWEQPTEEMKLAYMPFALGKRNCFGQSLANSEMQYIASRLCSKYQFDVVDPGTCDFTLVYHPVGAKVKATRI